MKRAIRKTVCAMVGPGLLVGAAALTPLPADDKRAFTLEEFYRVKSPANLVLSPDGSTLLYDLGDTELARGKSNRDLYALTPGSEPRRYTWTVEASETQPTFSPDGKQIAFVARRGEQEHAQLWLMPARGGEARSLTEVSTGISDPLWSPDGKSIAFSSSVYAECGADEECNKQRAERKAAGPLNAHVTDHLLYRHWTSWADGKVSHILLVDVESGNVRDMTPGDRDAPVFSLGGARGFAFSPDAKELCYGRNPEDRDALAWTTNSDLWIVPLAPDADGETAAARNITASNTAWDGAPLYSPDGGTIAYLKQTKPGYESDRFRLALFDRRNGKSKTITPQFDDWVGAFDWTPDGSALVFEAGVGGQTPLFRVELDGGAIEKLAEFASLDSFVLADDAATAYVVRRAIDAPGEVWRLDLTGKTDPLRLSHHNKQLQDEVDLRPAESIWVKGTGGRKIHVYLIKPHGFDPKKRYPLILNVHGGPQGMWADAFRGDWQMYPGAGYVLAFANPHGSTGYGQAFTEQISGDWGGQVFQDLMKVTDALEKLPFVDGERMGAMGWSYGGYMMNWFQGHTDRFKCLANMMGLYDLPSFYYATEELWFPEWDLGGKPWDSDLYQKWNPAASADKFDTPMLIISGELDFRVPYTQGLMAFTALRRRGIPARLIVLPESGHWPGWYEMALYYTAHLDWFHRYLGGDPPPWSVEDFAANAVFDAETGERIDGEEPPAAD